jgi:tyrosyl-tRNA synthetase
MIERMANKPEPIDEVTKLALVQEITTNAQILIPENGVEQKLKIAEEEGRPLRVKMGFDPTSPDLHLGHAVSMMQLKRFQRLGHLPVVIIGDFTGRIGDPSGKNKSRPTVEPEVLEENAKTYLDQLGRVLDTSKIEVHHNSDWLDKMTVSELIKVLAQGSLAQIISRDDFRKRLDNQSPIGLHEIVYPYLQGTDSVAVKADIEVGGVDQLYAFQAARTLQQGAGEAPEALVLMPLLRGLDGTNKMSKSLGNYIGLTDEPKDMFGKVMSIPDSLLEEYLRLASSFSVADIEEKLAGMNNGSLNPMDVKLDLASNITELYHDEAAAQDAKEYFDRQFRGSKEANKDYELVEVSGSNKDTIGLLLEIGAAKSKSEARRLIKQGGVRVNGERITDEEHFIKDILDTKVQVGKRRFYSLTIKSEE